MKFGFDIDDTLIDLRRYAFHLYNEKLGKNVSIEAFEEIKTLQIHKPFGLTDEEGGKMWVSLMEDIYFKNCPPFEGALEVVNKLYEEGHEIYYITSRPKHHCPRSKQWMIEQGFPVEDGHFFCGMEDDEKITTIQDLQLDYYFDDKPAVLQTLKETDTEVYIIDQPYNQEVEGKRIKKWEELKKV